MDLSRYRVTDGGGFSLAHHDPADRSQFTGGKKNGKARVAAHSLQLEELQERLYAEGERRLLVVLQAMDTAGKDSTIRHVFASVDPIGVNVTPFKKPTEEELAHDYLWRVHPHVPGDGEIAIFNRSHYEDVLVVRVRDLVPEQRWRRRYGHIRAFEQLLADEGTTIVKVFLNVSRAAQAERLQARLDDPTKRWKFRKGDLAERALWDDYMAAYEEAIAQTASPEAPWYIVPADRKWYRNLVVGQILIETLEGLGMSYPEPEEDLEDVEVV
ncbi:MAG: polyphosphate kinase 2 family protein [Acidimicrobiia bacterium]|nr:polyphosphate kinase 2 family protein [Acidimicrobiia bacterium]